MLHLKIRIEYNGNFTWLSSFQLSTMSDGDSDYHWIVKSIREIKSPRVTMVVTFVGE